MKLNVCLILFLILEILIFKDENYLIWDFNQSFLPFMRGLLYSPVCIPLDMTFARKRRNPVQIPVQAIIFLFKY